jgi:hypothetical protein
MGTVYPVGSLYFGTQSTCPLQALGIGTWTRIATNFVTGSTAPVVGNGMALGLTDGTINRPLVYASPAFGMSTKEDYTLGISASNQYITSRTTCVDQDPEKSGLIADLPTYTVNVWKRTA